MVVNLLNLPTGNQKVHKVMSLYPILNLNSYLYYFISNQSLNLSYFCFDYYQKIYSNLFS
jgi:hypothetical protein